MDVELGTESGSDTGDKRLNRLVAITVVVLSVLMGLGNIKDGDIVQDMAQAKADSVDRWGEYQATRTKLHIAATARAELAVMAALPASEAAAAAGIARLDDVIVKYTAEAPKPAREDLPTATTPSTSMTTSSTRVTR